MRAEVFQAKSGHGDAMALIGAAAIVEAPHSAIYEELLRVKGRRKTVTPAATVEWARLHPGSALHARFNWDDAKCGIAHRLWQARALIALYIHVEAGVRRFVSLTIDRKTGGGYRLLDDVVEDDRLRRVLVMDALAEFKRVRDKYRSIVEFAGVVSAIDEAESKIVTE